MREPSCCLAQNGSMINSLGRRRYSNPAVVGLGVGERGASVSAGASLCVCVGGWTYV